MRLFTSILQGPGSRRPERRARQRFAINPGFPLKAVLSCVGRDETGAPTGASRHGWNWKGRLLDCSDEGVRLKLGSGHNARAGDSCILRLSVEEFELVVPCHVANIREQDDNVVLGLAHDIVDRELLAAHRQLVEVLALAATLKPRHKKPVPDKTGYLVEQFANNRPARLTVWREKTSRGVVAFEFLLQENIVQAASGQPMEYMTAADGGTVAVPATDLKATEIHRLFTWVLPNLPDSVPADVREFLQGYV